MTMMSALLLIIASAAPGAEVPPVRLECSFTGEDPSSEQTGPRRIAFSIGTRGNRVESVSVDDPTGIFSSGNIVGSFSTAGGGSYAAMSSNEEPRWRGRIEQGRLTLTGVRREVTLTSSDQADWSGRLRYELPGAGSMRLVKDGALSCRSAVAAEGNPQ
jgi:hypothetical protein